MDRLAGDSPPEQERMSTPDEHVRTNREPPTPSRSVLKRNTLVGTGIVWLVLGMLLLPAAVFAGAGIWALVVYARSLAMLWTAVHDWRLDLLAARLDAANLAGNVLLCSLGYFALVFALNALAAGLLGRRRQRLFVVSGLALVLPSVIALSFGMQTALAWLHANLELVTFLEWLAPVYVFADAVALGMLLADARPLRKRGGLAAAPSTADSGPIAPIHLAAAPQEAVPEQEYMVESAPVIDDATDYMALREVSATDAPQADTVADERTG